MMPASKPALADAIWALIPRDVVGPTGQSRYILYGGSMVHRIPWQRDTTYNDTCIGSTQSTSPENVDIPLLSSTGIRKDYLRKMVPRNAAHVEELTQQWISHGIWS